MAKTASNSVNIYQEHILSIVAEAQKGDELLFVTPSTFFGFYSVGAETFEEVCKALSAAKGRGVKCQILIDVKDVFTATAAQGLLTFLQDGDELRSLNPNRGTYNLLRYREGGESVFIAFNSGAERKLIFLPGVTIRPFAGVLGTRDTLKDSEARTRREEFHLLWNRADKRVEDSIIRHVPSFYFRKHFEFVQVASFFGFFALGILFGLAVAITKYEEIRFSVWVIFAYVLFSILVGIIANFVTAWITQRGFGR